MSASLVSEAAYEAFKDSIGIHKWENENLDFPLGFWIPNSILESINVKRGQEDILKVVEDLPIFFGDIQLDKYAYSEASTCFSLSRQDGSTIRGISILKPYWYDDYCFDLKRDFRYHIPADIERYWRMIRCQADIDCLLECWDEQSGFSDWLKSL